MLPVTQNPLRKCDELIAVATVQRLGLKRRGSRWGRRRSHRLRRNDREQRGRPRGRGGRRVDALFLTSRILEAEPYRSNRFEVGFGLAARHRLAVGRATG